MKRTQIQLDDPTYQLLRKRAFERGMSVSALLREMLAQYLAPSPSEHRLEDLTFVGPGHSVRGDLAPVSERHDEVLAAALSG